MRRTSQLLLALDEEEGPIHQRLYRRMRTMILDGSWPAETRLPSSRELAKELGVSRNTALHAVEMLVADGIARSRPGSGVYVSPSRRRAAPSRAGQHSNSDLPRRPIPFEIGRHTAEFFPINRWNRLQQQISPAVREASLCGSDVAGWPDLRAAIASYAGAARGLTVAPDQVVVVSSTQSALDLLTRALAQRGDEIWTEDPGYHLASQLFEMNGLHTVPVRVDSEGLVVADGIARAPEARFAYLTPACQFPTGQTLSDARAQDLLAWARSKRAWIIEDDWEWHSSQLGATARTPLAALDPERVIFVQTFNRTIFPTLRVAFLIAPQAAIPAILEVHERLAGSPSVPTQAALAVFLSQGLYAGHLRATRSAYAKRRAALLEALEALPPAYSANRDRGGLHIVVDTPAGVDDAALAADLRAHGIECSGLTEFATENFAERGVILGFAAFTPDELTAAAARLIERLASLDGAARGMAE